MTLTPQLRAALTRAALGGTLTGLLMLVQGLGAGDAPSKALYAGLAALLGYLLTRGLGEGGVDSVRAATGDVRDADVGAYSEPLPRPGETGGG